MESSFGIIQELVRWVEQYTKDQGSENLTVEEFLIWMNSKVFTGSHGNPDQEGENHINMELSFLLIFQNRHFKSYAKQVLADHEISSPDSFSFLYHLSLVDGYRKMELVKMHMMEAPSGIEVLKRLLSKGLIEEFDDPDDKRATRIKLNEKGRTELRDCMPAMNQVFKQMAGDMNLSQKLNIIQNLREINSYHTDSKKKLNSGK